VTSRSRTSRIPMGPRYIIGLNEAVFAGSCERNSGHVDVDASLREFASFVGKTKRRQDWYSQNAFGDSQTILPGRACNAFGRRAVRWTDRAKNSDLFLAFPLLIGSTHAACDTPALLGLIRPDTSLPPAPLGDAAEPSVQAAVARLSGEDLVNPRRASPATPVRDRACSELPGDTS
jgi:hypothetical protein